MILVRLCKIALVASAALFFSLVAFGNFTDYGIPQLKPSLAGHCQSDRAGRRLLADHRD